MKIQNKTKNPSLNRREILGLETWFWSESVLSPRGLVGGFNSLIPLLTLGTGYFRNSFLRPLWDCELLCNLLSFMWLKSGFYPVGNRHLNTNFRQTCALYLKILGDRSLMEGSKKTCSFNMFICHSDLVPLIRKKRGRVFRGRKAPCLELGMCLLWGSRLIWGF